MTDRDALALTMWGEGRGEMVEGRIAIGCVIRTRVTVARKRPGGQALSYTDVCFANQQFSCWNVGDPNRPQLLALVGKPVTDPVLAECYWIADGIMSGATQSRVQQATHYHALLMKTKPAWTVGAELVARVGGHLFYEGVR